VAALIALPCTCLINHEAALIEQPQWVSCCFAWLLVAWLYGGLIFYGLLIMP
jgi:hypothetical protein